MTENRDDKGRFLVGHAEPGPGRSTDYKPEMNEQVRKLALLGCTDDEIAGVLGVQPATLYNWKQQYPAFLESINDGKIAADAEVATRLYDRAVGQVVFTEKQFKNSEGEYEVVRLHQRVPSDPTAARFWLSNRQQDKWRNRDHEQAPAQQVQRIEVVFIDPAERAKTINGTVNGSGG